MPNDTFFSGSLPKEEFNSEKFTLFVKAREVKVIAGILEKIALLSKRERKRWYKENADFVQRSFDTLISDSTELFEDIVLDDETLELSEDLIVSLRDAAYSLEAMIGDRDVLEG